MTLRALRRKHNGHGNGSLHSHSVAPEEKFDCSNSLKQPQQHNGNGLQHNANSHNNSSLLHSGGGEYGHFEEEGGDEKKDPILSSECLDEKEGL